MEINININLNIISFIIHLLKIICINLKERIVT